MARIYLMTENDKPITTSSYNPSGEDAVNGQAINNALDGLDVNDTAESGKYVSAVSEVNGKISVSRESFPEHISGDIEKPSSAEENQILVFDGQNWIAKNISIENADVNLCTKELLSTDNFSENEINGLTITIIDKYSLKIKGTASLDTTLVLFEDIEKRPEDVEPGSQILLSSKGLSENMNISLAYYEDIFGGWSPIIDFKNTYFITELSNYDIGEKIYITINKDEVCDNIIEFHMSKIGEALGSISDLIEHILNKFDGSGCLLSNYLPYGTTTILNSVNDKIDKPTSAIKNQVLTFDGENWDAQDVQNNGNNYTPGDGIDISEDNVISVKPNEEIINYEEYSIVAAYSTSGSGGSADTSHMKLIYNKSTKLAFFSGYFSSRYEYKANRTLFDLPSGFKNNLNNEQYLFASSENSQLYSLKCNGNGGTNINVGATDIPSNTILFCFGTLILDKEN